MIKKKDFLEKNRISNEEFKSTKLRWSELQRIHDRHLDSQANLEAAGKNILEQLSHISKIHSLKMRVKDPEHLLKKIIRKVLENRKRKINLDNYEAEITDLVGVRALHLYKEDWQEIHVGILSKWELHEKSTVYIREGDLPEGEVPQDCEVKNHPFGYRSVHYLVTSKPNKKVVITEIQVRTIFEEAWAEIDHQMRYPDDLDNDLLAGYLLMFNRLAGNADEMGSYIRLLKEGLARQKAETLEQARLRSEAIAELESLKNERVHDSQERNRLQEIINQLAKSQTHVPTKHDRLFNLYASGTVLDALTEAQRPTVRPTTLGGLAISAGNAIGSNSRSCTNCGSDMSNFVAGSFNTCPACFYPSFVVGA